MPYLNQMSKVLKKGNSMVKGIYLMKRTFDSAGVINHDKG